MKFKVSFFRELIPTKKEIENQAEEASSGMNRNDDFMSGYGEGAKWVCKIFLDEIIKELNK